MERLSKLNSLPKGLAADLDGEALPDAVLEWAESLPDEVLEITAKIADAGGGVWIVGGSVREGLSGQIPTEHDLATSLKPEKVVDLFPNSIKTGVKFGTVSVRTAAGGEMFEVTTLRADQEYLDGRRPESVVMGDSLAVDLERRDLTINAIAVDLARATLYDPHGGRDDIENQVVRAVGNAADRLSEDGLRIMRAYRFMDQGSGGVWQPDSDLSEALIACKHMLERVSVERIWQELSKILSGENASAVIDRLADDGILDDLFVGWNGSSANQSELSGLDGDELISARLSLLFYPNDATQSLRKLKAQNRIISAVGDINRRLGHLPDCNNVEQLRLYRAALGSRLGVQLATEYCLSPDTTGEVMQALTELPENHAGVVPLADGNWLSDITGLPSGIRLGRLKAWLHRIQIEHDLTSLDEIAEIVSELSWQEGDPNEWPKVCWP